jgi:RNase P subunit RPR2
VSTAVRSSCASCGTIEVPIGRARLIVALHGDDRRNQVEFDCPSCGSACREHVGERATRLLTRAGITVIAAMPQGDALSGERTDAAD